MPEDFRGFGEFSSNQSQDGDFQCDIVAIISARLLKSLNLQYVPKEMPVKSLCPDTNEKSLVTSTRDGTMNSDANHSVAEDLPPDDRIRCSLSIPTLSGLVSALKGSRQKLGAHPKKVSVSWAPDVYDPIPNSAYQEPSKNNKKDKKKECSSSGKNTRIPDKKKSRSFFTSMDNFLEDSEM